MKRENDLEWGIDFFEHTWNTPALAIDDLPLLSVFPFVWMVHGERVDVPYLHLV